MAFNFIPDPQPEGYCRYALVGFFPSPKAAALDWRCVDCGYIKRENAAVPEDSEWPEPWWYKLPIYNIPVINRMLVKRALRQRAVWQHMTFLDRCCVVTARKCNAR